MTPQELLMAACESAGIASATWYRLPEAARILGVHGGTLRRLVAAGRLPTVTVSQRNRRVTARDLAAFLASNYAHTAPTTTA